MSRATEHDLKDKSLRAPLANSKHGQLRTGSRAGMPRFLESQAGLGAVYHHSPPTSGPREEPLTAGRSAAHAFTRMRPDAFYRSPVNANNPVLTWTDGARLYFAPSAGQTSAGHIAAAPEAWFSPPAGYVLAELHWDRALDLATASPLLVIARKSGAPDLQVSISNSLEQRISYPIGGFGVAHGAEAVTAREGGEFVRSNDSHVSLEFSGAAGPGEIHNVDFGEGFYRYRVAGGSHDLYVGTGSSPAAYLVERLSGSITRTFASGTLAAIVPAGNGIVQLELRAAGSASAGTTQSIDLRSSPPRIASISGHASAETGYADARRRVEGLGVQLGETLLRFRVAELEMIEGALLAGSGKALDALRRFKELFNEPADPLLEVNKRPGPDNAYAMAEPGSGPPTVYVFEPFDRPDAERSATLRHELTHIIMGVIDSVEQAGLTRRQRADLEGSLRFEARQARDRARAGQLRRGEYWAGDIRPGAGNLASWRGAVGQDTALANLWVELMNRFSFLPDPEGTGEVRGVSLADESRYGTAQENTGHPAENVGEFTASFVTSATRYRAGFVAAVYAAETAGNARGGSGGTYLRRLYQRGWDRISSRYVPLGANPF
jgi:hypothetical protein